MEIGHTVEADERWRLFVFAAKDGRKLSDLCDFPQSAPGSPVRKHTPSGSDIDSVMDVRAVLQSGFRETDITALPDFLRPRKGRFGLTDYEKVFCPDLKNGRDIFDIRGIDRREGCVVIVRPNQYVAHVLPFDAHDELTAFFDGFKLALFRCSIGRIPRVKNPDSHRQLLFARRAMLALSGLTPWTLGTHGNAMAAEADPIGQPSTSDAAGFMDRAFEMRRIAVERGDQAYGAVVVQKDWIVGQSWSCVVIDRDPTSHAEMSAIRDTAHRLQSRDLSGSVMYSTSRPCPMCEGRRLLGRYRATGLRPRFEQRRPAETLPVTMHSRRTTLAVALSLLGSSLAQRACLAIAQQYAPDRLTVMDFLDAARSNDTDGLRQGLALGLPIDSRDDRDRTALLIATHANAIEAARLLIAAGADVNARDPLQDSPPTSMPEPRAGWKSSKMTVAAGADLQSVNRYGGTALIPAAHHGHVETVRYLLTTEVDIDHVNNLGWTALLEAAILGDGGPVYQAIVTLLLEGGADPTIGDDNGVTALVHARNCNMDEIAGLLEAALDARN